MKQTELGIVYMWQIKFLSDKNKTQLYFIILKLINYSCSQKPINYEHLGQVDESSVDTKWSGNTR